MNSAELEALAKTDPFNPLHHIALARGYLEEGAEEKARPIIAVKRKLPSKDPSVHFEWGDLCEELGMARQAVESYEKAIALNPQDPECHYRIALLYHEKGAWEKALKHLQRTVSLSPQNERARNLLVSLYDEMGFSGSARMLQGKWEKKEQLPQTFPFQPTGEEISSYLRLFSGREMGYARYHFVNTGNLVHSYVNRPLANGQIFRHLEGEETFGVYPLRSDRALKLSLIRVRVPWRRIVANIRNSGFLAISEDNVHQYATRIIGKVKDSGFPAYLEKPGNYERRIWFFFEDFIPGELAERFLNSLMDKIPAPGVDIAVDLVLGFKREGLGWQDHPVMLPLGINRRAGRRCFFIDEDGSPYENQLLIIQKIRAIARKEIEDFLRREKKGLTEDSHRTFEDLKNLEKACPVIEEIIKKAAAGRNLREEEKKAIYFTLGYLNDGIKILHEVLANCPDYRPTKIQKMVFRLGSHPISCPRIRTLLPEITGYVKCNCSFDIPPGGYPSPVLHIKTGSIAIKHTEPRPLSIKETEKKIHLISQQIGQLAEERERLKEILGQNMTNQG